MTDGFGFPFGCAAAVAAVIVADLAGATAHPWYALVPLGAVVLAAAHRSPLTPATGVAVVAWALHTGFVLHRFGELRFDHASALAAAVLATALLTGTLTRTAVSSIQVRESSAQVRKSSGRVRKSSGRVLRVP
ncbi:hypothetical protein [Amycolatopsis vancoresmycina]|uniref:Uncharacterized protein n=1 Tax=Amycolatopsis vancoresmycina DSM 44592 TaxID=1292037 RepID=R1ICC3_9PSEU|nr:hypothetical protein [Amycolatopsis vancoresmycina]EOD67999.1 hypothetical protein H480_13643 [Amycolatopsis vancoresmycina DSM 44592]